MRLCVTLSFPSRLGRQVFALVLALALGFISVAQAGDLPLAAGSPAAGISFDDRPLLLPVQRNFQMAMLTAGAELGRVCGPMEAYGWRMKATEQERVNQVFNNTVDRLRAQGFVVEAKSPRSVSRDVTLFTADRPDKHLVVMWSAGEIGLVMVLCEAPAPMASLRATPSTAMPVIQGAPTAQPETPLSLTKGKKKARITDFSPVGDWVGTYTCGQGTTGGTLHIAHLRGDLFDGVFRFYPTPKNPYVPSGRYQVYGEYDAEAHRILINPGKWIHRPDGYQNTIIIGNFDPLARTFSGYFQGINGCTSFEARYSVDSAEIEGLVKDASLYKAKKTKTKAAKPVKAKKKKVNKAKKAKKVEETVKAVEEAHPAPALPSSEAPVTAPAAQPTPVAAPAPASPPPPAPAPAPVAAPAPAPAPVPAPVPVVPAPTVEPKAAPVPPSSTTPPPVVPKAAVPSVTATAAPKKATLPSITATPKVPSRDASGASFMPAPDGGIAIDEQSSAIPVITQESVKGK